MKIEKTILGVAFVALISSTVASAKTVLRWGDLNARVGSTIELRQKVHFDDENVTVLPGSRFQLVEVTPLAAIPVYYVEAKAVDCHAPGQKAEMILVTPDPAFSDADPSVGVELDTECTFKIYIDLDDYLRASLFQESSR